MPDDEPKSPRDRARDAWKDWTPADVEEELAPWPPATGACPDDADPPRYLDMIERFLETDPGDDPVAVQVVLVESIHLNDLDGQRFSNAVKNPAPPTQALVELFRVDPVAPQPHRPAVLLVDPPSTPPAIREAIARRPEPVLLVIDRPKPAPAAKPDLDCWSPVLPAALAVYKERCWIGEPRPLAQRQAFRPTRINVTPPTEPVVAVPIRVSDCPRCKAQPGQRCVGIDRDDECHVERMWQCLGRWNGAS